MLHDNDFDQVRIWPRGVDLSQFSPSKRSATLRASWGVGEVQKTDTVVEVKMKDVGVHHTGRKASLPITPPETPEMVAVDAKDGEDVKLSKEIHSNPPSRVVLLYVGRM